jgi:hypothetical protein
VSGQVTPAMMQALAKIAQWCGRDFALTPVSNTLTRSLAKLGWVEMRVTKTYGAPGEKTRIVRCRVTRLGASALAAASSWA